MHGCSYHLQLALVILLRAFKMYQSDNAYDFNMTVEDPSGGKFDDIVYRYSSPKGFQGTVYVQAKHKQVPGNVDNASSTKRLRGKHKMKSGIDDNASSSKRLKGTVYMQAKHKEMTGNVDNASDKLPIRERELLAAWDSPSPFSIPKYFISFLDVEQQKLFPNRHTIDILTLVEHFVEQQLAILHTDKSGTTDSAAKTAAAKGKDAKLQKLFKRQRMLLAMYVIFDSKIRTKLLSEEEQEDASEFMAEVMQAQEKTGIVTGVQGGVPQDIWSYTMERTREFFDRLIIRESEGCEMHRTVLDKSEEKFSLCISENRTSMSFSGGLH
uniref:Uncharacterized protein n=1 Tax=Anopheles farauti TaxID=69004 RepID=A0A182Q720_9DIPT